MPQKKILNQIGQSDIINFKQYRESEWNDEYASALAQCSHNLSALCKDNIALQNALSEFCSSFYKELSALNETFRTQLSACLGTYTSLEGKNPKLSSQDTWKKFSYDLTELKNLIKEYELCKDRLLLSYSFVDIISLCEKIKRTFDDTARARHIDFSLENNVIHPEILRHFPCDAEKMQDAILSLLKHAFHIIPGVSYVKIQLLETKEKRGIIHIQRDGAMIPRKDFINLQAGNLSKEIYTKHFGLLTVRRFVESIHGKLEFFSDEEKTSITIYL